MAKETSYTLQEDLPSTDSTLNVETLPTAKKKFIEPELSTPVDVLEATSFFQTASSGATN